MEIAVLFVEVEGVHVGGVVVMRFIAKRTILDLIISIVRSVLNVMRIQEALY